MMAVEKILIIIPTYNEIENIEKLIKEIYAIESTIDILIVDDNSPDGTGERVKGLKDQFNNLYLIEREGKLGLGTAYVAGFKFALQNGYSIVFEMDADFSHDPKEIPNFLDAIKESDLVIGSRYIKGVNVVNWPLSRLLLSYFANRYTRVVTGLPLCDSTGGYKCFRRQVLEAINLEEIRSGGYSFQIEMNFKAWKKGFQLKEIPIIFIDRAVGKSKMSKQIIREAVWMVWKLKFKSLFGRLN
jgi:dolichol-phosphate mannosyltransferase